jgi:hypothetical protein
MTTEDATAPPCPKCGLSATCELCKLYGPLQHPAPAPVDVDGTELVHSTYVAEMTQTVLALRAEITALRERVAGHVQLNADLAMRVGEQITRAEAAERALEAADADALELRRVVAILYAGAALYSDDGELQDNRCAPFIDFKRDSLLEIRVKMTQRAALAGQDKGTP